MKPDPAPLRSMFPAWIVGLLGVLVGGAAVAAPAAAPAGTAAGAAPALQASMPRGLVYTESGHPLSVIPGRGDGAAFSSFSTGDIAYSPNGGHWVLTANGTPTAPDTSLSLLVSGTPQGVARVAADGDSLPGLGLAFDRLPDSVAINDRGILAFSMTALGASTADRQLIARYRPGTGLYDTVARQDQPIPGLALAVPGADDERYGSSLTVGTVLRNGQVAFVAQSTSGSLDTLQDEFVLLGTDPVRVAAQAGALVPGGQAGGGTAVLGNLERYAYTSADGRQQLLWGQLNTPDTPDVVVVNGQVVLQEGQAVPGLQGTVFAPTVQMFGGGDWTARGTSTAGERYLIVNGVLRVVSGRTLPGLWLDGPVQFVESAALSPRGDLAYAVTTTLGTPYIVVEPLGGTPFVAVSGDTELDVGGSPRGRLFYGGTLTGDLGLGLGLGPDNRGLLYFVTRARDTRGLNVADGLFVTTLRPAP